MPSSSSLYLDESSLSNGDPIDESTNLLAKFATSPSREPSRSAGCVDEDPPSPPPTPDDDDDGVLDHARRILYASHFFNQFSEQTWQFCLVLILAAVCNYRSLFLVTSYGLVSYLSVCAAGSPLGRFLDETSRSRLDVARGLILSQNCAVLGATALCYVLLRSLSYDNGRAWKGEMPTDVSSILLLVGIHLLGSMAAVLDSGFTVAVERDWIVVMSQCAAAGHGNDAREGDATEVVAENRDGEPRREQKKWLSDTNVAMRQIDLSCMVGAPAVAGFFIAWFDSSGSDGDETPSDHGYDVRGAALLMGGLNSLALIVEYICMAKVYSHIPVLAVSSVDAARPNAADAVPIQLLLNNIQENGAKSNLSEHRSWWVRLLPDAYQIYFDQQPVCWAGFSLSLLYLNVVLTFGGIMTAYLVWLGMGMGAIGFWRGVSSATGLAGTVLYHLMSTKMGLVDVGMLSVAFQFLSLSAAYASLFMDDVAASFVPLIAGVCLSRAGLWVFDIAVTQLMQQHVPAPIRGLVGGVQQSLNAFFTLVAFSLGLFISDPKYFHMYASVAYAGVGLAAIFYAHNVYSRSRRR